MLYGVLVDTKNEYSCKRGYRFGQMVDEIKGRCSTKSGKAAVEFKRGREENESIDSESKWAIVIVF